MLPLQTSRDVLRVPQLNGSHKYKCASCIEISYLLAHQAISCFLQSESVQQDVVRTAENQSGQPHKIPPPPPPTGDYSKPLEDKCVLDFWLVYAGSQPVNYYLVWPKFEKGCMGMRRQVSSQEGTPFPCTDLL